MKRRQTTNGGRWTARGTQGAKHLPTTPENPLVVVVTREGESECAGVSPTTKKKPKNKKPHTRMDCARGTARQQAARGGEKSEFYLAWMEHRGARGADTAAK